MPEIGLNIPIGEGFRSLQVNTVHLLVFAAYLYVELDPKTRDIRPESAFLTTQYRRSLQPWESTH